jgi:hypothetical protein
MSEAKLAERSNAHALDSEESVYSAYYVGFAPLTESEVGLALSVFSLSLDEENVRLFVQHTEDGCAISEFVEADLHSYDVEFVDHRFRVIVGEELVITY